jgi:hypothetical protein
LNKLAQKRKDKMLKFAKRANFSIDYNSATILNELKILKEKELKRLMDKYVEVKLNVEKGINMFVVLATIIGAKEAFNKLGEIFAKKLVRIQQFLKNLTFYRK